MYKNYYEKFKKNDLSNGQKYEKWFADTFLNEYTQNDDKLYDIKTDLFSYEIKCDSNCFVFYRFGYEVSSWNGLSGIWSTDADYWVCICPVMNEVIITKVDRVKNFIKQHKHVAKLSGTGDGKSSKMILWDWSYFMDNMIEKDVIKINVPLFYGTPGKVHLFNKLKSYMDSNDCKERREDNEKINSHYERMEKRIKK